jgi:hypothetical protein
MAVEGTLDLFKLPEILQLISQQKKTGILTVQSQQDIVAISFLNGAIVAVDALNQTLEEGLSKVLVSEGLLSAVELSRAVAEQQGAGGRLLDLLVERRCIGRPELLLALRLQTRKLLEELLRWEQGDFKFYSGDEVFYEEGFVPITVEELLLHAAESAPRPAPRAALPATPGTAGAARTPGTPGMPAGVPATTPAAPRRPAPAEPRPAATAPPANLRVIRNEPAAKPAAPAKAPARPVPAPPAVPAPAAGAEAVSGAFRKMTVEHPATAPLSQRLVPGLLGAGLAALLAAALLSSPGALVLPFPWQDHERQDMARSQRSSLYLKVDRAAKTFFLLEGRFPDRLEQLAAAGLLSSFDLRDPQGRRLRYMQGGESYGLQPVGSRGPVVAEGTSEAITGNFLLDPEFFSLPSESKEQPLVLLD